MDQRLIFAAMLLLILPSIAAMDPWVKLNSYPVCFGARKNTFGSFSVPYGGKITAVKLVHLSGYVTCDRRKFSYWSFWGCGKRPAVKDHVGVVITNSTSYIITPQSPFLKSTPPGKFSNLPRFKSFSPEIILPRFSPFPVISGEELRLWYGEDLVGFTEHDNDGRVCCNVYALYD